MVRTSRKCPTSTSMPEFWLSRRKPLTIRVCQILPRPRYHSSKYDPMCGVPLLASSTAVPSLESTNRHSRERQRLGCSIEREAHWRSIYSWCPLFFTDKM